jgi:hypothetical protein
MAKKLSVTEGFDPKKIRNRTTISAISAGLIALLFVVVTFLAGLYLFPSAPGLPNARPLGGAQPANWSMGDITSLATFSLVVGGLLFGFINYVQNAVQRKRDDAEASFNIYQEMYSRLMNSEALEARRWVIVNLPTLEEMGNDRDAWLKHVTNKINRAPRGRSGKRSPGQEYLKSILNTFDFIGFVAKHYWNMENELVIWMSPPVAKVWERIYLYVEKEAEARNEPDYYQSARDFADYCLNWRRENRPKSKVIPNGT